MVSSCKIQSDKANWKLENFLNLVFFYSHKKKFRPSTYNFQALEIFRSYLIHMLLELETML